jgi:hypothetical protein
MLASGQGTFSKAQYYCYLQNLGPSFGGQVNHVTIFEKKMLIRKCIENPILESIRNGVFQSSVCPEQVTHLMEHSSNPLILVVSRPLSQVAARD